MTKQTGLGDNAYVAGYNLSGDVQALTRVGGGPAALNTTAIDKSAFERLGGKRDGAIEFITFFNPSAGASHAALKTLPRADAIVTYFRGTALGGRCASCTAKQIGYDGTRDDEGNFTLVVSAQSNGFGVEWGRSLTAGVRTDTDATDGTSIDTTASLSLGAQAYLHVTAFTGTDATVKIQDSANNADFTDVTGLTFTQITAAPASERLQTGRTATVRRYLRAVTVTTGGFDSISFAVQITKNRAAVNF